MSNALVSATTATSYDANNRLATWGQDTLLYDADGNLTSDGTFSYTWNARNQLMQITDIASGNVVASFTYDPLGRRQSKDIGGTVSQYLYDGPNIVQSQDGAGNFVANYISGGIDQWFARQSATGTDSYLTDALGSTLKILDGAGTELVNYTYDVYGNTKASADYPNPFQYTGRENDGNGLYYYRARYYSPAYQRFISSDPTGLNGGINVYAYVEGNPISFIDPLGLEDKLPTYANPGGYRFPGIKPGPNYLKPNPEFPECTGKPNYIDKCLAKCSNTYTKGFAACGENAGDNGLKGSACETTWPAWLNNCSVHCRYDPPEKNKRKSR